MVGLVLLLLLASMPALAAVQARLDRDRVAPGESVQLTLERDGRGADEPDLAPLARDFTVLARASGSSLQIINGRMSARVELRLTLAPKGVGRIVIPPLAWAGERTPALTLEVAGNTGGNRATAPTGHVFMTSEVGQKSPYVQSAVPVKLRLYTDQPLYQASLDLAAGNDVLVQQVGKEKQSNETRGGRSYRVIERDYLLFPQRSGRISLPGPVLDAQVADPNGRNPLTDDPFFGKIFGRDPFAGMVNATRPLHLQGDPINLEVRPIPAGMNPRDWLPAQRVDLTEAWRPPGAVRAGEPVSRHLSLTALGLSAAQLPDLAALMPLPDGIKAYPDQARLNSADAQGNVTGSREQDVALIASRPGRYQLPAMKLAWWDTVRNAPRVAELPARTLEVLPGALSAVAPVPESPAAPLDAAPTHSVADYWPWLSLALGLLWLVTLVAWWRSRRASPEPVAVPDVAPKAGAARKALRQACRNQDAATARRHVLAWAAAHWTESPPAGIHALAARLDDTVLADLLRDLDRACYGGGAWDGSALASALERLPDRVKATRGKSSPLPGLYS